MKLAILCLLLGASRGVKSDSIRRADATNCLATKNGARVCSFNADNLVLDDASVVQLTVTEGGKTITCTRGERGENLDNW
jgi:hypothetical protein